MGKAKQTKKPDTHSPDKKAPKSSRAPIGAGLSFSTTPGFDREAMTPDDVMMLQRTLGNQATRRILSGELAIQRDDDDPPGGTSSSGGGLTSEMVTGMMSDEVQKLQKASVEFETAAKKLMRNLESEAPGASLLIGPVKSLARVKEKAGKKSKVKHDDGTSAMSLGKAMTVSSEIKDILRCTLVFDSFPQLARGYAKVARALQTYRSGMVVGIVKMDSWFGEGAEQSSGYRDAKIVFQVEPYGKAKKILGSMIHSLPALSIEVQFNVRAALAVKDAKVHGDDDWNFEIPGGAIGHQFDAMGFMEKLATMTTSDDRFGKLNDEMDEFIDTHREELTAGIPIAHHLYEPEKVALIVEEDKKKKKRSKEELTSHYNALYQRMYDFAYRASKFKLSSIDPATGKERETSGKGLHAAYQSMKKRYVKK